MFKTKGIWWLLRKVLSLEKTRWNFLDLVLNTWEALCELVAFEQIKKREIHQWRSFIFSKVAEFSLQLY